MNATELFHRDGRPAGAWYCGACRYTKRTEEDAERCCRPNRCKCGAETHRGWTACTECVHADRVAREQARFDQAIKQCIDEFDGRLVYVDDWDEYLDRDELDDRCTEVLAEFIALGGRPWEWEPPSVYATTADRPLIDASEIIDDALDDAFDGARDMIGLAAEKELKEFLVTWCGEHMPVVYRQNEKMALVPWAPDAGIGSSPPR